MAQIRRWLIDWESSSGGGGGTSALWFDTITGTTGNVVSIGNWLDAWETVASDLFTARLRSVADIFEDTTGQKVGEEAPNGIASRSGTVVGPPVPNQAQVVVRLRTGSFINGRRLQGRIFVPGMSSLSITANGEIDTSTQSTIGGSFPMANQRVFSPTHLTSDAVNNGSVDAEWKVLRRRRD